MHRRQPLSFRPLILIVDDCDYLSVPLEIALRCLDGYCVVRAFDAAGAWEVLLEPQVQFAAVITDLNMPVFEETRAQQARYQALRPKNGRDPLLNDGAQPRLVRASGYELIEVIRRSDRYRELPIIAMSGDEPNRVAEKALLSGANAFLAKPFSLTGMRRILRRLVADSDD